ncbi:MAG: endo-1,4-beta-xylanase [Ruminococcus sp.]|nr:endo-1,4-beta-xylanase [Ruminococcus sp.]
MKKTKIGAAITAAMCFSTVFASMPAYFSNTYAATIVENEFEANFDGWYNTNTDTVFNAVNGGGFGGSRGMKLSGRTSPEDGVASSKGLYLWGGTKYNYSFDVFSEYDETFHISLLYIDEETQEETTVELINEEVKGGEWATLTKSFKAPKGSCEFLITIRTDSTNDFSFDNVRITEKRDANVTYAAQSQKGLKDEFGEYFRVGNIFNGGTINNSAIQGIILKDHNAIECENETKPDATLVQSGSSNTNIKVKSSSFAAIADFCVKNNLSFRGHTLVWHSQTPQWFFKTNFQDGGQWCDKATMNQRLESYIKNMFDLYKTQYPQLDLYAYDVCNECISDGGNGGPRSGGYGNGASPWVQIYGNNDFIEQAFTFARQYAPETCKLFYNDYNEYAGGKKSSIINSILKPLKAKGVLDGMGMQSHMDCSDKNAWGSTEEYIKAMDEYLSLGIEVQVTELDLSRDNNKYTDAQQATKYKAIFQHCVDVNKNNTYPGKITLVQVWGPNDSNSWVRIKDRDENKPNYPLLYNGSNQPKSAYTAITSIIPTSEWTTGIPYTGPGSTGFVPLPPKLIEPDENGYYFHHTFEGDTFNWSGRGAASVKVSSDTAYAGTQSLYCSGRTASWNGASYSISTNPFEPGKTFSFSALACSTSPTLDTVKFKFTLQYTGSDNEAHYSEIASGTAPSGSWIQLANQSYTIPEDASNLLIYVETDDESTGDFYVDEVIGAVEGTKIAGPKAPVVRTLNIGDVTFDGKINVFDVIAIRKGLKNGISDVLAARAADVDQNGSLEVADLVLEQNFVMGRIKEFPEPPITKPNVSEFVTAFSGITAASTWKKDGENNPCTTQRFGADPGWLVYDGRLYLYTTADEFEYQNNGNMQENTYASGYINCISTADMVNWTDHGQIPVAKTRTSGAIASWANNAWAPDAAWKNIGGQDKFFLYFANNGSGIGVITADDPTFTKNVKDPLGHELISRSTPNSNVTWLFDPGVYYDPVTDTGIIAYGGGVPNGKAAKTEQGRIAKLGDDMISIVGTPIDPGTPYLFEDSSMIKLGDTWYYSFCHNWNVPGGASENGNSFSNADIGYMTSTNPLKDYKYQGVVFKNTGSQRIDNGGNNHHSIISFKDRLYVAYHSRQQAIRMTQANGYKFYNTKGELTDSKDGNYRSTQINEATLSNGKITCNGDMKGCTQIEKLDVYSKVQAETMSNQSKNISVSGRGDTTVKGKKGDWIKVSGADLSKGVKSITAKGSGGKLKFTTGSVDGDVIGYIDLSSGAESTLGSVSSPSGTKDIYIEFSDDVTLDYWFFS